MLLPLGLYLALKLIPKHVMAEAREWATARTPSRWGAAVIVLGWLALLGAILYTLVRRFW